MASETVGYCEAVTHTSAGRPARCGGRGAMTYAWAMTNFSSSPCTAARRTTRQFAARARLHQRIKEDRFADGILGTARSSVCPCQPSQNSVALLHNLSSAHLPPEPTCMHLLGHILCRLSSSSLSPKGSPASPSARSATTAAVHTMSSYSASHPKRSNANPAGHPRPTWHRA